MKNKKIWGDTENIYMKNGVSINRITIEKGYCSKHKHEHKNNIFYVEAGNIILKIWEEGFSEPIEQLLVEGEITQIKAGVYHQFICNDEAVVYEIYDVDLKDEDIIRDNSGGVL